jgi:hypothetical protein
MGSEKAAKADGGEKSVVPMVLGQRLENSCMSRFLHTHSRLFSSPILVIVVYRRCRGVLLSLSEC